MSARGLALRQMVAATSGRRRLVMITALLGSGAVLAAIGLLTTSGYLISRAALQPEILSLTLIIVGVRFFGTIRALLRYGERLASHELAFRTLSDLRSIFFARLIPQVPAGLPGLGRADLLRRFVGDVDRLQDLYLRALTPPVIAAVSSVVAVGVAALILPVAGLVLAASLLLGGVVAPLITRLVARRAGQRQAGARARLGATLLEIVEGSAELTVAGRAPDWLARCRREDGELGRLQRRDALSGGLAGGLSSGLSVAAAVAVVAVAIPAVSDGRLNGVLLAALALLALASFEAVQPLGAAAANLDACADAAVRIQSVIESPVPVTYPAAAPRLLSPSPSLRADCIAFGYGAEPLFEALSFELAPGTATALIGPSGVGKSSLTELLVRFRDPDHGRLSLDGVDLRELPEKLLRENIRLAAQDAHLFDASLRENLRIGAPQASDARLAATLERVGLAPWLDSLPDGLGTDLGEGGLAVSGGQRQRIATARVLLSAAPIQIFDEPTAHLDPKGAAAMLGELAAVAARERRAVLVITHELEDPAPFTQVIDLSHHRTGASL